MNVLVEQHELIIDSIRERQERALELFGGKSLIDVVADLVARQRQTANHIHIEAQRDYQRTLEKH